MYECNPFAPICGTAIALHPQASGVGDGVCVSHQYGSIPLRFCDERRYYCAITGGVDPNTLLGRPIDAHIEWFWATAYDVVGGRQFITGKFTYVASFDHILNQYNANIAAGSGSGWFAIPGNPGEFGIPLFNPSNHNS